MITKALPKTVNQSNSAPDLAQNSLIFARTSDPYYYPKHKTPYLFATHSVGKGRYRLNDQPIQISNRDFYFLNASDELEIRFEEKQPLETLFILFEEKFINESLQSMRNSNEKLLNDPSSQEGGVLALPPIPFDLTVEIKEVLGRLVNSTMSKDQLDLILFDLLSIIDNLNRESFGKLNRIPALKTSTRLELYKRLHSAKVFINDHINHRIDLEQISRSAGMNKFHLLSHFRKRYGTTPYQYLVELKLQKAERMLGSQRYTVTEVCNALGFESIGSFSNKFAKRFQVRPSSLLK